MPGLRKGDLPDPIRMVTRIKNNRLLLLKKELGITSREFAKQIGISLTTYFDLISLNRYPSATIAAKVSAATGIGAEDLFPTYLKNVTRSVAIRTIPDHQLVALSEARMVPYLETGPDVLLLEEEKRDRLESILHTLTPREEQIIKMRFGLGDGGEHTLDEIAQRFSVSRERIRQIEAKAMRKLRHPSRSDYLRDLLSGTPMGSS